MKRSTAAALTAVLAASCLNCAPAPAGTPGLWVDPAWELVSSGSRRLPAPPKGWRDQTACLVLDIDRDGVDDFVITDRNAAPSVLWYRRMESGWGIYVIESAAVPIGAGGHFADIDGDGDLDISFGGRFDSNEIWWWENPYPDFDPHRPWRRRTIKNSGDSGHHDQVFGDFDSDGRLELAAWNQGGRRLLLFEVPEDPKAKTEWPRRTIFRYRPDARHEGLAKADINDDGRLDLVGGGYWFEYQTGGTFTAHIVDPSQHFARAAAGQLVPGGWAEIVLGAGDTAGPLRWYEYKDGEWEAHQLLEGVEHGHSLAIADIDRDGFQDIFCAEMGRWGKTVNPEPKAWIFYGDGHGGFRKSLLSRHVAFHESRLGDVDGDGDLDIVAKPFRLGAPGISLLLQHGSGQPRKPFPLDRWKRRVIGEKPDRGMFIDSADIDGDGLLDAVTAAWWYRNPGSLRAAWERRPIGEPLRNMAVVYDFDRDGDPDILGTKGKGSEANSELVWARNDFPRGFTILDNVDDGEGRFIQGAAAARLRAGAPISVLLSWHAPPGRRLQILTVPADPSRGRWRIAPLFDYGKPTKQLDVADIDRDGDLDVLFVGNAAFGDLVWLRNDGGGRWRPFTWFRGAGNKSHRVVLGDIDGDGAVEAVVGHYREDPGYLAWYDPPSPPTRLWTEHVIAAADQIYGPMSLALADMDGDSDLDVVAGEHRVKDLASARLWIFENLDGSGRRWKPHLVHQGDEHHQGTHVVDIDRDGDLDILSIGWMHSRVLLYENKAIP